MLGRLVILLFAAAGVLAIVAGAFQAWDGFRSGDWPEAPGVILTVDIEEHRSRGRRQGVRKTSKTYEPTVPAGGRYGNIEVLRLEAEDGTRPHVRFRPDAASLEITFEAAAATGDPRELIIDGLWLGLLAATLVPEVVADGDTPAGTVGS